MIRYAVTFVAPADTTVYVDVPEKVDMTDRKAVDDLVDGAFQELPGGLCHQCSHDWQIGDADAYDPATGEPYCVDEIGEN